MVERVRTLLHGLGRYAVPMLEGKHVAIDGKNVRNLAAWDVNYRNRVLGFA